MLERIFAVSRLCLEGIPNVTYVVNNKALNEEQA